MNPIAISAFNPGPMTGAGNWTWLIPGRVPTLVDAGVGEPRHLAALEAALGPHALAQVLVTHAHVDHASGAPAIAARMSGARCLKMPWPERDGRWAAPWEPLADGDRIEAGDTSLVAVHTPGHAPDHLCFWYEPSRALFGGDLVLEGTTVWIPTHGGDLRAYLASLERVRALAPARIFPAHGSIVEDPARLIGTYIEHRLEREGQIVDLLRQGHSHIAEVVARLYPQLPAALAPRARETALAHLLKLERDGRVRRAGDAWHIIDGTSQGLTRGAPSS